MLFSVWDLFYGTFRHCLCSAGAFVTGIIVPREGGLAIALTEKLEDMVAIIFLPLVSVTYRLVTTFLTSFTVLHTFGAFHRSWPVGRWYNLGVHHRYYCDSVYWKVRRVYARCKVCCWL